MPAPYNVICSPRIKINTFAYSEVNEKKKMCRIFRLPRSPILEKSQIPYNNGHIEKCIGNGCRYWDSANARVADGEGNHFTTFDMHKWLCHTMAVHNNILLSMDLLLLLLLLFCYCQCGGYANVRRNIGERQTLYVDEMKRNLWIFTPFHLQYKP